MIPGSSLVYDYWFPCIRPASLTPVINVDRNSSHMDPCRSHDNTFLRRGAVCVSVWPRDSERKRNPYGNAQAVRECRLKIYNVCIVHNLNRLCIVQRLCMQKKREKVQSSLPPASYLELKILFWEMEEKCFNVPVLNLIKIKDTFPPSSPGCLRASSHS